MCFTETWLHEYIPDSNTTVDGFQTVRADRSHRESGKRKGGGLAILVNNKWCHPGHVTVKECVCSSDIELLAVSLRPYYLPREFSHMIILVVYIPPSANVALATDVIQTVVARLQTQHPDLGTSIMQLWLQHCPPSSSLWTVPQGKIRHWTYCMPMLRKLTAPLPFLHLEDLTTTSSTCGPF